LRKFLLEQMDNLCDLCKTRFDKNPLRILDCKTPSCKGLLKNAPSVLDALDDECGNHFKALQELLTCFKIPFVIDPKVVRGLDYYTRTVFEFIREGEPSVLGGGRYDGLISQVGGPATPGVGFGMGLDRLVILLQKQGNLPDLTLCPQIYIGNASHEGFVKAQELVYALRGAGIRAESDLVGRSVKAQMKYANKINAGFTTILGESELETNTAKVKNMKTGEQYDVTFENLLTFAY